KLEWMNGEYIKQADSEKVIVLALPHLVEAQELDETDKEKMNWAKEIIRLYQEQLRYGAEIVPLTSLFFKTEISYDEDAKAVLEEEQVIEVLQVFTDKLLHLDDFSADSVKE